MGLLSSIQKIALTPSAYVGKQVLKVVKPSSSIAQQPISTTTSQLQKTTAGKILGTAIAGTAVALAVTAVPSASLATAGKTAGKVAVSIVKNPVGAVKTAVGGVLVGGAIAGGGLTLLPVVFKGGKVGAEVLTGKKDLTPENIGDVAKVVGLVAGGAVVAGVAGYVGKKVLEGGLPEVVGTAPLETVGSALQTDTQGVTTQATESISTKKRARKAKVKRFDGVRQSVRVNVINRSSANRKTVTYLNRVPLYN